VLLVQMAHLQHEQIDNIGRTPDLPPHALVAHQHALPKLDRGFELRSAGNADAGRAVTGTLLSSFIFEPDR